MVKLKGLFFPVVGDPYWVEVPTTTYEDTGIEPTLQGLYDLLECRTVELLRLPDGDVWIDEEGKLKGLPFNVLATFLFGRWLLPGDVLVGPVLLIRRGQYPNQAG